jgi:hypothetical protein
MKFIISEDQHKKVSEISGFKKLFFKYWDKFGPSISEINQSFSAVDLVKNNRIDKHDLNKWLVEWRGLKETIQYIEQSMNGEHNVNEYETFGGYDFNFSFDNYKFEEDKKRPGVYYLHCDCYVDDINGVVELIAADGESYSIEEAINNDDYGWEIKSEVDWGIKEWVKHIEDKSGVDIYYYITFKSDE